MLLPFIALDNAVYEQYFPSRNFIPRKKRLVGIIYIFYLCIIKTMIYSL